jgi:hypothetical protein
MIFGSFANFALNDWGVTLIIFCEVLMALSFLIDIVINLIERFKLKSRVKISVTQLVLMYIMLLCILLIIVTYNFLDSTPKIIPMVTLISFLALGVIIIIEALYDFFKKIESQGNYESFFLFIFFAALIFKNFSWPGTGVMLVFSILFLVPYFITTTIKFFKQNYKFGKPLVVILTFGSISTILLGITYLMKTMHWPGATIAFYLAVSITLIMIGGTIKWKYEFNGIKTNILEGLRLFKTNIILLFFMLFVYTSYKYLTIIKLAPDYYSSDYPESYYKLRNNFATEEDWIKANEIRDAYDNFIDKAVENGFIK